jgi:hypothetical protein
MTTLATDKPRPYDLGDVSDYPVVAGDIIYEGAAVGENASGYARPLVAGDYFLGFALAKADNSAGAAGAIDVRCQITGKIQLPISELVITSNDQAPVYASDDDTFTLTAGSNTLIGNVSRFASSGIGIIRFDVARKAAAVSKADLDSGISYGAMIVYADDEYTTTGGAAAEAITVTGALATDHAYVSVQDDGTNNVTVKYAVCTTDTLTVTFSGDPGNDAVINYIVVRASS